MPTSQAPVPGFGSADESQGADKAANDTDAPARPPARTVPDGASAATPLFLRSLADAEELLSFAANTGRFPHEGSGAASGAHQAVINGIINARAAVETGTLAKEPTCAFWAAYADLSRMTSPVTAELLRASMASPVAALKAFVVFLATVIILGSIFFFMNNSIAAQVGQLMEEQNASALRLWAHVQYYQNAAEGPERRPDAPAGGDAGGSATTRGRAFAAATQSTAAAVARVTPDELFAEVVEFSRKSHWLRETAWRLNQYFNPPGLRIDTAPVDFGDKHLERLRHLNVPPSIRTVPEMSEEALHQIVVYQHIRNFSQATWKTNSVLYDGITTYLLPAVYALLGAALYGFRHYARLVEQRAYLKSSANSARYFIALIAGIVIGLFSSLLPENLTLPPLAIAFLVGYAVEAFFSRLDGFIERMRGEGSAPPGAAARPAPERAANAA